LAGDAAFRLGANVDHRARSHGDQTLHNSVREPVVAASLYQEEMGQG
jgi:hypothetical protein